MSFHTKRRFYFTLAFFCLIAFFWMKTFGKCDSSIALITLNGKISEEYVEWKNPYSSYTKATLPTYEVELILLPKKDIFKEFFFGDLLGIRFKLIELYPFLHWIGFKDLVVIDSLESDYIDLDKKRIFPCKSIAVQKSTSAFWESIFYNKLSPFWIKKASLKTEFFPLTDPSSGKPMNKRSFQVTYQSGSLEIKDLTLFQSDSSTPFALK